MATPKKNAATNAPAAPKPDESKPDTSKPGGPESAGLDNKPPAAAKTVKALSVQSARDGFRRAGRPWSKQATVVLLSDLNNEQIDLIKGEAVLTVTEVEVPAQEAAE